MGRSESFAEEWLMKFELLLKEGAKSDITAGHLYYQRISDSLADDFLNAVEEALNLIHQSPESYPAVLGEIRVKRIRRFPYLVSFLIEANSIFESKGSGVINARVGGWNYQGHAMTMLTKQANCITR